MIKPRTVSRRSYVIQYRETSWPRDRWEDYHTRPYTILRAATNHFKNITPSRKISYRLVRFSPKSPPRRLRYLKTTYK